MSQVNVCPPALPAPTTGRGSNKRGKNEEGSVFIRRRSVFHVSNAILGMQPRVLLTNVKQLELLLTTGRCGAIRGRKVRVPGIR